MKFLIALIIYIFIGITVLIRTLWNSITWQQRYLFAPSDGTEFDILLSILFAFVGVVLALWYENLGSPRLQLLPHVTTDGPRQRGRRARFLHLLVKNTPLKVPFVPRKTAFQCHGDIKFYNSKREQIGNPMPIRWDGNPEPIRFEIVNGEVVGVIENSLLRLSRYIDIPPDEQESLAIAVRIHSETLAYGWTGKSYQYDWRHPDYELPQGNYVASVKITTGDDVFRADFSFVNPEVYEEFDLKMTNT